MAKVTVTYEDLADGGVSVSVESDPSFPSPEKMMEWKNGDESVELTDAQQMGIRMTELLTEELYKQQQEEHDHEHDCGHDCGHDHDYDS
jgi:hypothetical protein